MCLLRTRIPSYVTQTIITHKKLQADTTLSNIKPIFGFPQVAPPNILHETSCPIETPGTNLPLQPISALEPRHSRYNFLCGLFQDEKREIISCLLHPVAASLWNPRPGLIDHRGYGGCERSEGDKGSCLRHSALIVSFFFWKQR